jgi:hypothetical protein
MPPTKKIVSLVNRPNLASLELKSETHHRPTSNIPNDHRTPDASGQGQRPELIFYRENWFLFSSRLKLSLL